MWKQLRPWLLEKPLTHPFVIAMNEPSLLSQSANGPKLNEVQLRTQETEVKLREAAPLDWKSCH